jgi:hypothetical protein
LARTNEDVYRVKALLQKQLGDRFTLLIQGEESRFDRRRDVAELLDTLSQKDGPLLREHLESELRRSEYQKWTANCPARQHDLYYLATEYLQEASRDATARDFVDYVHEMSRDGNYLRVVARHRAVEVGRGRILLSTIHKVKGIEFPSVILLHSALAVRAASIDEELRVMYVGMTRAEDVLVALKSEREVRLLQRQPFDPEHQFSDGLVVAPSLRDVDMSYFGAHIGRTEVIKNEVLPGNPVEIQKVIKGGGELPEYRLYLGATNRWFGKLANPKSERNKAPNLAWRLQNSDQFNDRGRFQGLEVTGIYRRYVEEDEKTDRETGTPFAKRLCPEVKEKGYYYVIEIGGVVRPA